MKEFSLPISDCGCFLAGDLGNGINPGPEGKPWPKNGVVVFYETKEAMQAAFKAVSDAHWPGNDDL